MINTLISFGIAEMSTVDTLFFAKGNLA